MTATRSIIESVGGHHLVLEAFPELFHALLDAGALEGVEVLDDRVILRGPLQLQSRLLLAPRRLPLVRVCVQQIEDLLIVQLDVGAGDGDFSGFVVVS